MSTTSSLPTEVGALARRLKKGYTLKATSRGHWRIVDPEGNYVERNGKVIQLSGTGDHAGVRNMRHDLEQAGVLRTTPTKRTSNGNEEAKKKRAEALRKAVADRARTRQAEANELHDRLEYILRNVGSLELPGMAADLGFVGAHVARSMGVAGITPDLAASSASRVSHRQWVDPRYQAIWNELGDRLEAVDVVEEWYALIREARGLPRDEVVVGKPAKGEWPFTVELLSVDAMTVDHDYQRPVAWPFVRKLAATFDETLVGTIDVSERRPGAVYAVLDGQLRFEASKLVGKTTVWASVYRGLDVASEARFFLKKNRDRKSMHPYYTFKARVAAQDEDAVAIEKIVSEFGYRLAIGAPKMGTATATHIAAIAAVEEAYERKQRDGTDALRPTLRTLKEATFERDQGQSALLIRGLSQIFANFGGEIDEPRLVELLARLGPTTVIGRARDLSASSSGGGAGYFVARVLLSEYSRQGGPALRLPPPHQQPRKGRARI